MTRKIIRKAFRRACFVFLRWLGFLALWRYVHRNSVTILMIHGVMGKEESSLWVPLRTRLTPQRLDGILRLLSRHYRFISFDDAVAMVTGKKEIQPYSLAVTFDDGYRNNITRALPVLRKYGVPAVLFVSSGNVEDRRPYWFDRLDFALQHAPAGTREVRIGRKTILLDRTSRSSLRDSYARIRAAAKEILRDDAEMIEELEGLASFLERENGRELAEIFEVDEWSALLTWEEIRCVSGSPDMLFQTHTSDHVRLGLVSEQTVREQILNSKKMLETHTGVPCRFLCYPSGSFSVRTMEIAKECGIEAAVTTMPGPNRSGDDPMALRRVHVSTDGSDAELLADICGLARITWEWRDRFFKKASKCEPRGDMVLGQ